jgi:hypothetical protein
MLVWFKPDHPAAPAPPTNAAGDLPSGNQAMQPLAAPKKPPKAPTGHAPGSPLPGQQQAAHNPSQPPVAAQEPPQ